MEAARILVVEDTDLLRRMYRDRLAQDGHEVFDAADGLAALSVLRERPIDLILLDLMMPRMGGIEVLEAVGADLRTKHVPVIVLTNLGEADTIERAVELGAVDYLIKNETRPADVAEKVRLTLAAFRKAGEGQLTAYHVSLQDRVGDVDRLIEHARLKRRLWCPACERELSLELVPAGSRHGHYDAQFVCVPCRRSFATGS